MKYKDTYTFASKKDEKLESFDRKIKSVRVTETTFTLTELYLAAKKLEDYLAAIEKTYEEIDEQNRNMEAGIKKMNKKVFDHNLLYKVQLEDKKIEVQKVLDETTADLKVIKKQLKLK